MSTRVDEELEEVEEVKDEAESEADDDPQDEADLDELADEDPPDEDEDPPARGWFASPRRVAILLGVVSVLLAGVGTWGLVAAGNLRDSATARNTALVDTGGTAEVSAAISTAVNQIFSYSYDKTEVTEQAAKAVLRGDALITYDKLFAEVRAKAPEQKIVLTTRVVYAAVRSLEGDQAQLFVFLDQSATRVDTNTTSGAAAQLLITAKREGEHWVITDMAPR